MHNRFRHLMLGRWAALMCDHPWKVLGFAVLLAAASITITALGLEFQADRNALIADELDWNQRYIQYREDFGANDQIAVVVELPTDVPVAEALSQARGFIDDVVARIETSEHIKRAWYRIETDAILMRLLPLGEYTEGLEQMAQARPLLESATPGELVAKLIVGLRQQSDEDQTAEQATAQIDLIRKFAQINRRVLEGESITVDMAAAELGLGDRWQYLASDDGRLLFIDIEAARVEGEVDPAAPAVADVRAALAMVRAEYPNINAGLTGIPVMEADETIVSMRDSTKCSIIALIAIAVLMIVAFHGWRLPALAVGSLMFGVAWSFGFLTLSIGHLQVLSVIFTVILLGLGIDFGIHMISKFELVRRDHPDDASGFRASMVDTFQSAGPGIVTGAITTAVAFGTTLLTDFKGMAEMGLIAGVGVLLCLVAMFTVLPAVMRLFWNSHRRYTPGHRRLVDLHATTWLTPLTRHPVVTLAVAAAVVAAAIPLALTVRYDNDLTQLLPSNLESTIWQDKVLDHSDKAIWYAASIVDDLDEAKRRTEKFRSLDTAASVGGVGLLFPPDEQVKADRAEALRIELGDTLTRVPADPAKASVVGYTQQLRAVSLMLAIAMQREDIRSEPTVHAALGTLASEVTQTLGVVDSADFVEVAEVRGQAQQQLFSELRELVRRRIDRATLPRPLALTDLPEYLSIDAVSLAGPDRYQLKVYPLENVWNPDDLEPFVNDITSIDPKATGSPFQIYYSGQLMLDSYLFAGGAALLAVFVLVLVDFARLSDALLCLLPVAIGFAAMLAISKLAGVTINPANITVLPLMFGIGVDAGVHIMHRYHQDRRASPPGLGHGTGKGIMLTSVTTIIGFSAMMLAEHRGIRSLGFVLAVGIAMTLAACLLVMPAVLSLRNRYHVWRRYKQWQQIVRVKNERYDG